MVNEFLKAFKKAEILEKSRAETYKKYAEEVAFPAGKEVLLFLVKAEEQHFKFLKEQEKRLKAGEKVTISKLKETAPKFKLAEESSIKDNLEGLEGDIGILRAAAKLEEEDIIFYKNLLKDIKKKESKRLFQVIQKMEVSHLDLINKTIDLALLPTEPTKIFFKMSKARGEGKKS